MRRFLLSLFLFAVPLSSGAESIAFVNVNVIPMDAERTLRAQTVLVRDDVITAMGPVADTVVPDDATVVDGTDRYLLPGLSEMHGHITSTNAATLDRVLGLFLANGVTTVRGMLGRPSHLRLRARLLTHEVIGPRLVTSGPSFNGGSVDNPTQAAEMVREQHEAGYDFLKIHPGLTNAEFWAIADTANELGIPFAGHVPSDVGLHEALSAGIATIDHLDGYMEALLPPREDPSGGLGGFFGIALALAVDESRLPAVVAATVEAGTWNVPTESLFEHTANDVSPELMRDWPEMKYVPRAVVQRWVGVKNQLRGDPSLDGSSTPQRAIDIRRQVIHALHAAGAGLLLGSDAPQRFNVPGFALHRELEFLVAAGLTPYEALRTGTVNAAEFFGAADRRGTVAVGKVADLVLLDQNPLEDVSHSKRVHGTMVRGRWLSRAELDRLLAGAVRD